MEGPQPGLPEAKRGCNLRRETCNVRYCSLLRLRLRCPFCQSARRWLSGQKGVFPRERSDLQGKCDSSGGKPPRTKVLWLSHGTFREIRAFGTSLQPKRVGATKERCGFSPALAGEENATAVAVSHHGLKSCGSHMGLSTKSEISGQVSNRSESERRRSVADFPRL